MDMTNQDYGKLVNQYSQSSPLGKNMVWAFLAVSYTHLTLPTN